MIASVLCAPSSLWAAGLGSQLDELARPPVQGVVPAMDDGEGALIRGAASSQIEVSSVPQALNQAPLSPRKSQPSSAVDALQFPFALLAEFPIPLPQANSIPMAMSSVVSTPAPEVAPSPAP